MMPIWHEWRQDDVIPLMNHVIIRQLDVDSNFLCRSIFNGQANLISIRVSDFDLNRYEK